MLENKLTLINNLFRQMPGKTVDYQNVYISSKQNALIFPREIFM